MAMPKASSEHGAFHAADTKAPENRTLSAPFESISRAPNGHADAKTPARAGDGNENCLAHSSARK